jgi:hypothetical protein
VVWRNLQYSLNALLLGAHIPSTLLTSTAGTRQRFFSFSKARSITAANSS